MKAIKWWCDCCNLWVRPATASTIYKCPYCSTNLTSVKEWDAHYNESIDKEAGKIPDKEKVEEWASDFKSYVDELDIARDDYRGIIEYIDDVLAILRELRPVVLCGDCKYWNAGTCLNDNVSRQIEDCGCYPDFVTDSSWFCAEGERR